MNTLTAIKKHPFTLELNREEAALILRGLELLPDHERRNVVSENLVRQLELIVAVWDKTVRTTQAIQAEKRKVHAARKRK